MSPALRRILAHIAEKRQAKDGRGELVDHSVRIGQRVSLALHQSNARAVLKRLLPPAAPATAVRALTSAPEDADPEEGVGEWDWDPRLEVPPVSPTR